MGRVARAATIVSAAAMLGIATPALAQFGSIFSDAPPRPPADVPQGAGQPGSAGAPIDGPRDYPRTVRPAPQPLDIEAPADQPPSQGPARGAIQAQPLPPPPGSPAAPPAPVAVPAKLPSGEPPRSASQAAPAPQAPLTPQTPLTPQAPDQTSPPANSSGQSKEASLPPQETTVPPPPHRIANPVAVFNGLDKITGRITSFQVKIGETVQFGALQVTPRACYSRPPTETPRTDAFISVDEVTLQGQVRRIFTGWMFAASPGLHAVEHPIYDVWLTGCKGGSVDVAAGNGAEASEPAKPEPAQTSAKHSSRHP